MEESSGTRRRSNRPDVDRTGYISMEDDHLPHSGVRGGRSCCLCAIIVFLFVLAVINALITAGLIYFLSITHEGMMSLEFIPESGHLRVLSDIELEDLQVNDIVGEIETDLDLSGEEIAIGLKDGSRVIFNGNETYVISDDLKLETSQGKPLFSTQSGLDLETYHVKNLHASAIDVGSILPLQVTSQNMFPDLLIESFKDAHVFGMEGVEVDTDGSVDIVTKDKDITVTSLYGSLSFNQEEGIFMGTNLPVDGKDDQNRENQYKVCVCGSNGHVFVVPDTGVNSGCHVANENVNPCA
ncbi:hypothetical protein ACF0H5_010178 [Mactra antiquata]